MDKIKRFFKQRSSSHLRQRSLSKRWHLDMPLIIGLLILISFGLTVLYSASNQNLAIFERQLLRLSLAFVVMLVVAQIPPQKFKHWAPWLFLIGVVLLLAVLAIGYTGKGAQRWLNLGVIRFQPSELLKVAVPLTVAWYLSKQTLPPTLWTLCKASVIIIIPMGLIMKQPDLGTALMIGISGAAVLFLAGMRWRVIISLFAIIAASLPLLWHFMHNYQQQRVLTFLNPERDPLGSGYHIIQSKIAIGSGGLFGKGWLNGTQSHLNFIPEHSTDFIFAVSGEEFGLIGSIALIIIYVYITARCFYMSCHAQDTFLRLVAGSLSLSFFIATFINIGMVIGILPVVGLPLPLFSYGGTSMVTMMAMFGIIISIHTHRKLIGA